MIEGPEALDRFRSALKAVLTVPESALPPSPFKKSRPKTEARKTKPSTGESPKAGACRSAIGDSMQLYYAFVVRNCIQRSPASPLHARALEPVLQKAAGELPALSSPGPRQSGKTTLLKHVFGDKCGHFGISNGASQP